MSSPGIILTSKFTMPNSEDFTKYVDYLTREKAILEKEKLTTSEKNELDLMKIGRQTLFEQSELNSDNALQKIKSSDRRQQEASDILSNSFDFDNINNRDFTKMVSYMARNYALDQKQRLTKAEATEQSLIKKAMQKFSTPQNTSDTSDKVLNGVFSKDSSFVDTNDLADVKDKFVTAQKNGSILYQDVISFDNKFLKKNNLLDGKNNLDESRLKIAAVKMMDTLFEQEKLKETGYWFASIHRNTKHVHIHFATIESQNTRKIVEVNRDGKRYLEPKGSRRQLTLDKMKTAFANDLLDRSEQLKQISTLRNQLIVDIKTDLLKSTTKDNLNLIDKLYKTLPRNRNEWHYGTKTQSAANQINDKSRQLLDKLSDNLVKNNPNYSAYNRLVKKESEFKKSVYGNSDREHKDYEANKLVDMRKRLGNSLLKEMKNYDTFQQKTQEVYAEKQDEFKQSFNKGRLKYNDQVTHYKLLGHLKRVANSSDLDYQNQLVYQRIQQAGQIYQGSY